MSAYTFSVEHADREPIVRTRTLPDEAEALAFAQQLLRDWPDCQTVDVRQGEELVTRLRRRT